MVSEATCTLKVYNVLVGQILDENATGDLLGKLLIFRDRKLKKFVSDTGDVSKKKIRTEDGTYLPATYKSGRYEIWQKKQKIKYMNEENEVATTASSNKRMDYRVCAFFKASLLF